MRTDPFPVNNETSQNGTGDSWRDHTMDLSEHLRKEARDNTAGGGEENNAPPLVEEKKEHTAPAAAAAGAFDDGRPEQRAEEKFDEFVKGLEETDAVTLANILVQIFNVGRVFLVPNMYFNLTYSGQERFDIRGIMDKAAANEKKNLKPEDGFNDYEKRLYSKLPKLREAMENSSYTNQEIDLVSGLLARRIQEMTVAVFLARYMWILAIAQIEISKGKFIIEQKGNDFFNNKLGLK